MGLGSVLGGVGGSAFGGPFGMFLGSTAGQTLENVFRKRDPLQGAREGAISGGLGVAMGGAMDPTFLSGPTGTGLGASSSLGGSSLGPATAGNPATLSPVSGLSSGSTFGGDAIANFPAPNILTGGGSQLNKLGVPNFGPGLGNMPVARLDSGLDASGNLTKQIGSGFDKRDGVSGLVLGNAMQPYQPDPQMPIPPPPSLPRPRSNGMWRPSDPAALAEQTRRRLLGGVGNITLSPRFRR